MVWCSLDYVGLDWGTWLVRWKWIGGVSDGILAHLQVGPTCQTLKLQPALAGASQPNRLIEATSAAGRRRHPFQEGFFFSEFQQGFSCPSFLHYAAGSSDTFVPVVGEELLSAATGRRNCEVKRAWEVKRWAHTKPSAIWPERCRTEGGSRTQVWFYRRLS